MIRVSVIVPITKVDTYLSECLISVCRQSLKEIEIICIDMDPKANAAKFLQSFTENDHRIKIFNGKNKDIAPAYNFGVSTAKGKYIAFVSSHDWITPDFIERLYHGAQENEADIACASCMSINKQGDAVPEIKYGKIQPANSLTEKFKLLKMPDNNFLFNKLFRKKIVTDNLLLFSGDEDYAKIIWLSQYVKSCGSVVAVPRVYYYHRPEAVNNEKSGLRRARQAQIKMMVDHKIKVKIPYSRKTKIRFLGIPFIKILENSSYRRYYFCGIKLMEVTSTKKF